MSFFTWLESIQKKPERTRMRILIGTMLVIMLFIIGIWVSLPNTNTAKEENKNIASPFETLWDGLKENAN